jgi:hypothetical protein
VAQDLVDFDQKLFALRVRESNLQPLKAEDSRTPQLAFHIFSLQLEIYFFAKLILTVENRFAFFSTLKSFLFDVWRKKEVFFSRI